MHASRRIKRQAAGFTAAALVHGTFLLGVWVPRAPAATGAQFSDGTLGVSVSLVRWPSSSSSASAPQSEAQRLEQLRQSLVGTEPANPPAPDSKSAADAAAILDAFDKPRPSPSTSSTISQAAPVKPAGAGGVIQDPLGGAAVPQSYLRAAAGNVLWPQLTRCWRPIRAQPNVELLVTLDDHGQLTEPPSVVREASANVDDLRLSAETEAIRAAKACAPYTAAMAGPQRSFRLDFSAQRTGPD